VLVSVLARAAGQIGVGIVTGSALVVLMQSMATNGMSVRVVVLIASVAALMTVVGLIAAIGPARRALAIQPTEALKME
jgi:ABC-type antimicrobial peptide transport system permease subunit